MKGERIVCNDANVHAISVDVSTARRAIVYLEGGPVRVYWDGRSPTVSEGIRMFDNGVLELETKQAIKNFKAIKDDAAGVQDGVLEVVIEEI